MRIDESNIQVDDLAVIHLYLNQGVEVRIFPNNTIKVFNYLDKSYNGSYHIPPHVLQKRQRSSAEDQGQPTEENVKSSHQFIPESQARPPLLCAAGCDKKGFITSIDHPGASIRHKGCRLDVTLTHCRRVLFQTQLGTIRFCHVSNFARNSTSGQGLAVGYTLDEMGIGLLLDHLPPMAPPPSSSFSCTSILNCEDESDEGERVRWRREIVINDEGRDANQTEPLPKEESHEGKIELSPTNLPDTTSRWKALNYLTLKQSESRVRKEALVERLKSSYEIVKRAHHYDDKDRKLSCTLISGFKILQDNISGELEIRDLRPVSNQSCNEPFQEYGRRVICLIPALNKIWIESGTLKISVEANGVVSIKNQELKLDATPFRLTVNNQKFASGFSIDGHLFLKKLR